MLRRYIFFWALFLSGASADCPPGTEVGPCLCMEDVSANLVLECTGVTDGAEISAVLQQIQVATVNSLDIKQSPSLLSLPDGVFGDTAVQHLRFQNTGLQNLTFSVFSGATSGSLTSLYIKYCSSFRNFDSELASLPSLQQLYVSSTAVSSLSDPLPHSGLQYMDFTFNSIDSIADDYFANAQNVSVVLLGFNQLTSEALQNTTLNFALNSDLYFDLGYNSITQGLLDVNFSGAVPKELILSGNDITELLEQSFSDLLNEMAAQYGTVDPYILLDNNPLTCGCELAWIVNHPQRSLLNSAQCSNGQLLDNLGPADFADC